MDFGSDDSLDLASTQGSSDLDLFGDYSDGLGNDNALNTDGGSFPLDSFELAATPQDSTNPNGAEQPQVFPNDDPSSYCTIRFLSSDCRTKRKFVFFSFFFFQSSIFSFPQIHIFI